jgi:hypothetical protein
MKRQATVESPAEPMAIGGQLLYKVADAVRVLRMSRAFIYRQIREGRLRTVKEGDATFITAGALAEYVALLEREARDRAARGGGT